MAVHFAEDAIRFLRGLERHNDREWFGARKAIYEAALKEPLLALIGEVNERMVSFAPEHVKPAPKIMLRIYRDTRFSSDKRPYKTRLSAWWGRTGMQKTSGAGFYFDLSATSMTIAAGVFMPDREQMLHLRRFLLEHGEEVRAQLDSRALARVGLVRVDGQPLARAPKGFPKEHPMEDLLRCRRWGVSSTLPAAAALTPGLNREMNRRFRVAAPMVHLLNRPLARRETQLSTAPFPL